MKLNKIGLFLSLGVCVSFCQGIICSSVISSSSTSETVLHESGTEKSVEIIGDSEGKFETGKVFVFSAPGIKNVSAESSNAFFSINDDKVSLSFANVDSIEDCQIVFSFDDGQTRNLTIHFQKQNENTFYSFLSRDSLLRYMGIGIDPSWDNDTLAAQHYESSSLSINKITIFKPMYIGQLVGTMKWENSAGDVYPLAGMKVKLVTSYQNYETVTDKTGYYSFLVMALDVEENPYEDVELHLYSENDSMKVVYGNNNSLYEKCWTGIDASDKYSGILCHTFKPDDDIGKAMQIAQAAKYFSDYATSLNSGNAIESCTFKYPADSSSSKYVYSHKTVYIPDLTNSKTFLHSYEAWDVIGHEYGHHIEHLFGFTKSDRGNHYFSDNLADAKVEDNTALMVDKRDGMRLAWTEAWADYFSISAQQTFPDDIKGINTVGDSSYSSVFVNEYSFDSYDDKGNKGEACEGAIARFLYKLYSSETDDIDEFSLGDQALWDIVVTEKPYQFLNLLNALYFKGYSTSYLGLLLEAYGMSATNLKNSVKIPTSNEIPTFSWTAQGGSTYFPNDKFTLLFYDANSELIITIRGITTTKYTLTKSEWNTIQKADGIYYSVQIISEATTGVGTGPYYSSLYSFAKTGNYQEIDGTLHQKKDDEYVPIH